MTNVILPENPCKAFSVLLDPGHHPYTPGKRSLQIPPGFCEWQFNYAVVDKIYESLYKKAAIYYHSLEVPCIIEIDQKINYYDNMNIPIVDRVDENNDLLISIQCNASPNVTDKNPWDKHTHGRIIFYNSYGKVFAKKLYNYMLKNLSQISIRRSGLECGELHYKLLRIAAERKLPAVLVECGFMTNLHDVEVLKNTIDLHADIISDVIMQYAYELQFTNA